LGNLTADEVEKQYVDAMGPELGRLYHRLWNECAWIHWKWSEFNELFGENPKRIELLNECAPQFFSLIQQSLWEDILLTISRLTDPATSPGRKQNLSLTALTQFVATEICPELQSLIETAAQKAAFARDWRNRRIAHRDLNVALQQSSTPLAPATRAGVRECLAAIAAVLNVIENTTVAELLFTIGITPRMAQSHFFT
jgi:hypothetical protein